jgi:hypothetical protein
MWPYAWLQPLTTMGDLTKTSGEYKSVCLENTVGVGERLLIVLSRFKFFL